MPNTPCAPETATEALVSAGNGIYSIQSDYADIIEIRSTCGTHTNYERLNSKSIRFACDLPKSCCQLAMTYTINKNLCS